MRTISIRRPIFLLTLVLAGWSVRTALAEPPESRPDLPASDAGRREDPEPTISTYDSGNLRRDDITTVTALAFSPDGTTLAAACRTGEVRFYETATGRLRGTLRVTTRTSIKSLAYAPDNRTLAVCYGPGAVSLWDVVTGRQRAVLRQDGHPMSIVAYSPDGATLAATASSPDGLHLWDVATGQPRAVLRGHEPWARTGIARVTGLAFAPDGRSLASAGDDKTVRLWDVADGRLRATLEGPRSFSSVAFSPDGATLAAGEWYQIPDRSGDRQAIRFWDVATSRERGLIEAPDLEVLRSPGQRLAFLPGGTALVSIGNGWKQTGVVVQLWDSVDRRLLDVATLPRTREYVCSAVSPDGKLVAVGGFWSNHRFGSIDLLAVEEGKALRLREPARED